MFIMGAIFFARVCIFLGVRNLCINITDRNRTHGHRIIELSHDIGSQTGKTVTFHIKVLALTTRGDSHSAKVPFLTFEVTTASNRTTKMLIPKEDRKKIHQYLFQRE